MINLKMKNHQLNQSKQDAEKESPVKQDAEKESPVKQDAEKESTE